MPNNAKRATYSSLPSGKASSSGYRRVSDLSLYRESKGPRRLDASKHTFKVNALLSTYFYSARVEIQLQLRYAQRISSIGRISRTTALAPGTKANQARHLTALATTAVEHMAMESFCWNPMKKKMRLHRSLAGTATTQIPRTLSFPVSDAACFHLTSYCTLHICTCTILDSRIAGYWRFPLSLLPTKSCQSHQSIKESAPSPHPEPLDATGRALLVPIAPYVTCLCKCFDP